MYSGINYKCFNINTFYVKAVIFKGMGLKIVEREYVAYCLALFELSISINSRVNERSVNYL